MSANAASLRRVLRSIGTHTTPAANTLSALSKRTLHTKSYTRQQTSTAPPLEHTPQDVPVANPKTLSNNAPDASSPQADNSKFVIRRDKSTPREGTDGIKPKNREDGSFGKGYFQAQKSDAKHQMKKRARRHLLSKQRSEIPEKEAWKDILRILRMHSPTGAEHYTKSMETLRLPEGIFAQWIRDPGESILEVMQRTGSHVQVKPTKEIGLFSSITLLGKPAQNAAAKKLLQESNLLSAVSEDDLNASKSLADYHLRSEIGGPVTRTDTTRNTMQSLDHPADDQLDSVELAQLEDVVSSTFTDQTRAVWSPPATAPLKERLNLRRPDGQVVGTSESAEPLSAVALTARIEQLTSERPRQLSRMNRHRAEVPLKDQLVALLTKPGNAHLISPVAARMALRYLAKHMHFPAIREVLNALKDIKPQLDASLFNALLDAAAKHENVVAFHYIVNTMRERSIPVNAGTWVAFHTLMLKRFPGDADKVVASMKTKAVQVDPSVAVENLEAFSPQLLASFHKETPDASIKDFVEDIKRDTAGVKWLTTFSANTMCHFLLEHGKMQQAFEVVDELVRHGGRPDVVTLNTFLTAAKKDGNMEVAISMLRKFHDLHTRSTALVSSPENTLTLPRVHDLSITPNLRTFNLLFDLAWDRQYFNSVRVFWRYACCAGHIEHNTAKTMDISATSHGANKGFALSEKVTSPRTAMWLAWAAKLAMGVKVGLGPVQAAEVLPLVGPVFNAEESGASSLDKTTAGNPPSAPLSRRAKTYYRRKLIKADQNEVQSLKPLRSLAEIAEEAWRKDREWKDKFLGVPKGLEIHGDGDAMLDFMLKEAIEVPVEVGDGVGMKLSEP